jgi:hypothetical protein
MARVKDWLIDMESYTWEAIEKGLSLNETIAYVRRNMKDIDSSYVEEIYKQYERDY